MLLCLLLPVFGCCVLQHNGRYISDNRMNFTFGTSERGSLEKAFDALQAELDALGVSDGLTRQQVRHIQTASNPAGGMSGTCMSGHGRK